MFHLVPYKYKGCWRDFDVTAFALPLLEGTDPKLIEPYKKRADPVNDCASVSQNRGFKGKNQAKQVNSLENRNSLVSAFQEMNEGLILIHLYYIKYIFRKFM